MYIYLQWNTIQTEILTHATEWMNLEDNLLSEISQTKKDKYCMILSYGLSRVVEVRTEKERIMVTGRTSGNGECGITV